MSRQVARLFGNTEWKPVSWFTGNAGASVEHDSLAGTHTAPRVSGAFHLDQENTVRLGYAQAYRTGSIIDYLGDRRYLPYATTSGTPITMGSLYRRRFLGDEHMPAEKLESMELGYLGEWKPLRMSLDVRLFEEKIPNRLMVISRSLPLSLCDIRDTNGTCAGSTSADYTTAVQNVSIHGIEYQWRWQPFDSTRLMLGQAFLNIDQQFLQDVVLSTQDRTKLDQLTRQSAPTHSTSLLLMQKLPYDVDLSLAGYWLGSSRWSQNTLVPSYQRLDARLAKRFRIGDQRLELAYTVQSLDGAHVEYKGWNNVTNDASLYAARIVERRNWVTLQLDY